MSWRLPRAEFERKKGRGNRNAMRRLVERGEQIGILAYLGGEPIGWCAVAPREVFLRLGNSRVLKPIDEKPVWSITCFFIKKEFRRRGVSIQMLRGVIAECARKGARVLEAYPILPYATNMPAAFAWTGFLSSFTRAGFREAKRWSPSRPIVRYEL